MNASNAEVMRLLQETAAILITLQSNLSQRHDNGDSLEGCEPAVRELTQAVVTASARCALAVKIHRRSDMTANDNGGK